MTFDMLIVFGSLTRKIKLKIRKKFSRFFYNFSISNHGHPKLSTPELRLILRLLSCGVMASTTLHRPFLIRISPRLPTTTPVLTLTSVPIVLLIFVQSSRIVLMRLVHTFASVLMVTREMDELMKEGLSIFQYLENSFLRQLLEY